MTFRAGCAVDARIHIPDASFFSIGKSKRKCGREDDVEARSAIRHYSVGRVGGRHLANPFTHLDNEDLCRERRLAGADPRSARDQAGDAWRQT